MPLEKIPEPITIESIQMNGISMHVIFWSFIISRLFFMGWKNTLLLILAEYLISIFIRNRELNKKYKKSSLRDVKEGDVIIVCRGGVAGESSDWAELFMYHISGLLYTQSVYGHVGQVFMDMDGVLKVADVRFNKKNKDSHMHYVSTLPDFINEYEGVHYLVPRTPQLSKEESYRLTRAVYTIAPIAGHCVDCFNPIRLLKTPTKDSSMREILDFSKEYGLGCAENVTMIQRLAGISKIDNKWVLPYHFSSDKISVL